jgi:hypothetical protein
MKRVSYESLRTYFHLELYKTINHCCYSGPAKLLFTYVYMRCSDQVPPSYNEFSKGEQKTWSSAERRQSFVGQNNRCCGHKIN